MDGPGIFRAARLLADARRSGTRLHGLPAGTAPRDLDEAYAIQVACERLLDSQIAGYKIGLTTANAQRAFGASEPIAGRLAAGAIRPSPAVIVPTTAHLRIVEAEVVFEIGADLSLSDAPFSGAAVVRAIANAYAGIEVCDSRFSNGDELDLLHLVADNCNADLLVIGEVLDGWRAADLRSLSVTLQCSGATPVAGSTAAVLGNPLSAVLWLANWLAARGETLTRGQLIASGSCTGFRELHDGDAAVATFGTLGRVEARFQAPN